MADSKFAGRRIRVSVASKSRAGHTGDVMSMELTALCLRLRAIYATAVAAQLALRCQAAEQDLEIAEALRAGVCDALGDRLDELGAIILRCGDSRTRE